MVFNMSDSPDLPVAAYLQYVGHVATGRKTASVTKPKESSLEVDELVRKSDAEETINWQDAYSFKKGLERGREQERQKILEKIENKEQEYSHPKEHFIDGRARVLRNLLEELRDDLEEREQESGDSVNLKEEYEALEGHKILDKIKEEKTIDLDNQDGD